MLITAVEARTGKMIRNGQKVEFHESGGLRSTIKPFFVRQYDKRASRKKLFTLTSLLSYTIPTMPIANNMLTGAILAPVLTILAAISLATVHRGIEWVSFVAKTPQK
jgi:hypothetical protein